MPIRFTKMQALGNDFVLVERFDQEAPEPGALARACCERRLGVGADGLILIGPAADPNAHFRIEIFNADGSRAEACGNGLRCAVLLALEAGRAAGGAVTVETDAGLRHARLEAGRGSAFVRVDMGAPVLEPRAIPVDLPGPRAVAVPLGATGLRGTCVSLGNPHVVVFVDALEEFPLELRGPELARHPLFPRGANVHFAKALDRNRIQARTWERGVGPTPACGTGACALCAAGVLEGRTDRSITALLPGGELEIHWSDTDGRISMAGPARPVFSGLFPWPP